MADIRKFSDQVIDLAERLANVADAAQGKDTKTTGLRARWLLLPAAGAGDVRPNDERRVHAPGQDSCQ